MTELPLLIVTPHNAVQVPQDILWEMLGEPSLDLEVRERHLNRLFDQGDPYTELIFQRPGAHHLHATVSRFVVDLNRERDSRGDDGVVKRADFDAVPLYPPDYAFSEESLEERLQRYWDPFHREVAWVLHEQRVDLLITGHAMSPFGPALAPDTRCCRPAITLMTAGDGRGEPAGAAPSVVPAAAQALQVAAAHRFASLLEGVPEVPAKVVLNDPWSVDEISFLYSRPERTHPVPGFGLEVNRALYLVPGLPRERPCPERLRTLQRAFAAFAEDAIEIIYSQGGQG